MVRKSQCALLSLVLMLAALLPSAPAFAAADLLPDLGMARLRDLRMENTSDGRRLLRFTSVGANTGAGPVELRAQRASTTSPWTVTQRIYNNVGGFRDVTTSATLVFGGDGHNHWHVKDFETYELDRLDNGSKVGTGIKSGFCFFDTEVFGAVSPAVYTTANSCKGGLSGLQTKMGISAGWGDRYGANLPDQYIDITGLTAGQYRLMATADPSNSFREMNENNNSTWVDIQLTGSGLTVQAYGSSAMPLAGNQLMNRGFELDTNADGRPDNWTSNAKFTRSNEAVLEGSFVGKHYTTDDSGYTISQVVNNLAGGATYAFSGYVNIPSTSDTFAFSLLMRWYRIDGSTISTSTLKTFTDDTAGKWQQVTANMVAPAGTISGSVRMVPSSLNAAIYVDDFKFGRK
jgi:hypothetical protein